MLGPLFLITLGSTGLFVLLVPAILISISNGDTAIAIEMALLASLGAFVSIMILAALANRIRGLERELNFVSLVMVWVTTPLSAAICLMVLADYGFARAWFEAVGALTTSGASVMATDRVPTGLLFWRASLEWYGGLLTLISIIHVLAPAGFGGLTPSNRRRGTAHHREGHWGALDAYTAIFWQYGALTVVIALGLLFCQVRPADAVMLAMIAIATGGFLPFSDPLEEHVNAGAMMIMAFGFCFGTLSVFWRRNILRRPLRMFHGNTEAAIVLAMIAALSILYAARISDASGAGGIAALGGAVLEGFFTASSLIATSGIESRPGVVALLPGFAVLLVVFVGASVYSTTGGIKVYRVAAMWIYARAELNRLIYPSAVSPLKFGRRHIDDSSIRAVWSLFVLALLCIAAGTVVIASTSTDFEGGLAMATALFTSAAPVYEALAPGGASEAIISDDLTIASAPQDGWPAFADLSLTGYLAAIVLMTIGRLEVLIVFAVINVRYWMKR